MKNVIKTFALSLLGALTAFAAAQPDPYEPDQQQPVNVAFNTGIQRSLEADIFLTSVPDVDYFALRALQGDTFRVGVGNLGYELTEANMSIELYRQELGGSYTLLATNPVGEVDIEYTEPENPNGPNYFRDYLVIVKERVPTVMGGGAGYMFAAIKVSQAVSLQSLSINPATVTGGQSATGTVTLAAPAPAGGITVSIFYQGPSSGPGSVLIPAGQTSANFTVTTSKVKRNTTSLISAQYGSDTKSFFLAVRK